MAPDGQTRRKRKMFNVALRIHLGMKDYIKLETRYAYNLHLRENIRKMVAHHRTMSILENVSILWLVSIIRN